MAVPLVNIAGATLLMTAPVSESTAPRMTEAPTHHGMRMSDLSVLGELAVEVAVTAMFGSLVAPVAAACQVIGL